MAEAIRVARIECDAALNTKLATHLQFAISGKPVFFTDSLADLIARHCPDIYQLALDKGYRFVPSTNPKDLEAKPPRINFDVIRVD